MKILKHIFPIIVSVAFLISCGGREGRVIPRGELAEIYAEMLMMDQWISNTPSVRRIADTSLVYEPILNRHGYTSADYRKSVDKYMDDPERFSRILRTTSEILDDKLEALEVKRIEHEKMLEWQKYLESIKVEVEFDIDEKVPYLFKEPYVHYYDSISVAMDSTMVYNINGIVCSDTTYDGIRMIVKDSLDVAVDTTALIK